MCSPSVVKHLIMVCLYTLFLTCYLLRLLLTFLAVSNWPFIKVNNNDFFQVSPVVEFLPIRWDHFASVRGRSIRKSRLNWWVFRNLQLSREKGSVVDGTMYPFWHPSNVHLLCFRLEYYFEVRDKSFLHWKHSASTFRYCTRVIQVHLFPRQGFILHLSLGEEFESNNFPIFLGKSRTKDDSSPL